MSQRGYQELLQAEVQHFRATVGVQRLLLITFLLVICGVPAIQTATEIWRGQFPAFLEVFAHLPSRSNLRDYEQGLENSSLVAQRVRPIVYCVWHKSFRYAGEKVVIGREGWLFYRQDIDYLLGRSDSASTTARDERTVSRDDPVSTIVDFRDQLAKRDIRLIVMPVPGKPSIYPDKVTWRFQGQVSSPTSDVIRRLRERGVEVIDLFAVFQQQRQSTNAPDSLYLRLDTHWSAETARATGELVANKIHELGWLSVGESRLQVYPVSIKRAGDLVRMIPLPEVATVYPAEVIRAYQVRDPDRHALYRDDRASPVLVLGDSFSRIYQSDAPRAAGFVAHLARGLGRPVASIINDGGASTLVRQQLKRNLSMLDGKKVVVWEFVERDVRFGTEGWKKVELEE